MRIVSLLPSATEIVCALGARGELVGVSHECDHPAGVAGVLPVLTRPRLEPGADSLAIDRSVRAVVEAGLSVYDLDAERLADLRPDVVVTQDLCEVCAVSYEEVCRAVADLAGHDVRVLSLRPTRLADILDDVRRVGRALGLEERAGRVAGAVEQRLEAVRERMGDRRPRPRVVTLEWLEPVMLGGTWMPELVSQAGGEPIGARSGERAPVLDTAALAGLDPDVVVVKPCGFTLERTLHERQLLPRMLPWAQWKAVAAGRVFLCDGHHFFNRPGPRIADSVEILAACFAPEAVPDLVRRHGTAAVRLDRELGIHPLGS